MNDSKTILVTGGSGLVGKAIEELVNSEARNNEKWIFVNSRDANLWYPLNFFSFVEIFLQ